MPNKRDPNKIRVQTWVTKEDKRALEKIAKDKGYSNLAEFLSAIAAGTVKLMLLVGVGRWMLGATPGQAVVATLNDAVHVGGWLIKAAIALCA